MKMSKTATYMDKPVLMFLLLFLVLAGCGAGLFPSRAHLRILDQGVDVWNQWREDNPEIHPVLAYFRHELEGASLIGVNFSSASFSSTNLSDADLETANFRDAYLNSTQFFNANLALADLSGAYLKFTDFTGANLAGANLTAAEILEANFASADLSGANLSGLFGWETISEIENCNIFGVSNAPEGFREWALENGAVEFE